MAFQVLVSQTFQRFFDGLEQDAKERVRAALKGLEQDPSSSRPGVDIKRLKGTDPAKHRLRVGPWRIVYHIERGARTVRVIEGFRRGRGYR